jgi:hypothetical protein
MTTTTNIGRAYVLNQLATDEKEFEGILSLAGISDSDQFTDDQLKTLRSAANQLRTQQTQQTRTSRSLPAFAPVGESQPTGTSQIAGGFQELLDGQYLTLEAQVNSALASHREKVENLLGGALDEALDIPFQIMEDFQDSQAIVGATALSLPQG